MNSSTAVLDRSRPFGTIYGDDGHGGVYYQDGRTFNGEGKCVHESAEAIAEAEARKNASAEEKALRRQQLQEELAALDAELGDGNADGNASGDLAEDLQKLTAAEVAKLVREEGLEVATGPGAKKRNIEALLAAAETEEVHEDEGGDEE